MEDNEQLNNDQGYDEGLIDGVAGQLKGKPGMQKPNEQEQPLDALYYEALRHNLQQYRTDKVELHINRTERPNSFQFRPGGPGSEVKFYFEDLKELTAFMKALADSEDIIFALNTIRSKYAEAMK